MTTLTASELRDDFASAVNRVAFGGERIVVRRNNKDVVALVSMEDLARLRELDDRTDRAAIGKSKRERGKDTPWEDVKKELR
ncbi:MAG: type II toxin-antitoxin system Phd/YefM family antitoxin [Candidatus Hydrogenedentes bacterium]|nr:type II toxin-antitoxin system Phd/YefM family antitoxin [Candidatus Hydrogenedentota bacterium]